MHHELIFNFPQKYSFDTIFLLTQVNVTILAFIGDI